MTKKKVFITTGIIAAIAIVIGVVYFTLSDKKEEDLTEYDRIAKVLTTTRKTDIFVIGDEIDFGDKIKAAHISEASGAQINESGDYKAVIVNDLNDKVNLSDDEIGFLREFINKEKNVLIYLGKKYSTTWDDKSKSTTSVGGNLLYSYFLYEGLPQGAIGGYLETDQGNPEILQMAVLSEIEYDLK